MFNMGIIPSGLHFPILSPCAHSFSSQFTVLSNVASVSHLLPFFSQPCSDLICLCKILLLALTTLVSGHVALCAAWFSRVDITMAIVYHLFQYHPLLSTQALKNVILSVDNFIYDYFHFTGRATETFSVNLFFYTREEKFQRLSGDKGLYLLKL